MTLKIPGSGLGQAQTCGGLSLIMNGVASLEEDNQVVLYYLSARLKFGLIRGVVFGGRGFKIGGLLYIVKRKS